MSPSSPSSSSSSKQVANLVNAKLQALQKAFETIANTRMADMPMNNRALRVATIGFELDAEGEWLEGILLTPWCMNLLRLPLAADALYLKVGRKYHRKFGTERFEFIGNAEDTLGGYESCSLFSPVLEFDSQAAALETAKQVLQTLRKSQLGKTQHSEGDNQNAKAEIPKIITPAEAPSRRGFLLGRRA